MKIKSNFVVCKLGEEDIAVSVGEQSEAFHGMIKLNETGAFLWKLFQTEHSEQDAVDALCAEYEVEEEIARRDVQKFIKLIEDHDFTE